MFEFLKMQYRLGRITKEELKKRVPKWITREQFEEIVKEEN